MSSPVDRPKPQFAADPVPALARAVIELFAEALPTVRFPDMDLAVLESAADDLRAAQVELEQIEAELAAARAALQAQAEQLSQRAQRALAYARVFAESDPDLALRVQQVGEVQRGAPLSAAPKRRGRPRRDDAADTSLFALGEAPALEATC
ncbi:MAG: hypothetical protein QM778_26895 [Myxococcales bacterium]